MELRAPAFMATVVSIQDFSGAATCTGRSRRTLLRYWWRWTTLGSTRTAGGGDSCGGHGLDCGKIRRGGCSQISIWPEGGGRDELHLLVCFMRKGERRGSRGPDG
jgi:hypothetical protein